MEQPEPLRLETKPTNHKSKAQILSQEKLTRRRRKCFTATVSFLLSARLTQTSVMIDKTNWSITNTAEFSHLCFTVTTWNTEKTENDQEPKIVVGCFTHREVFSRIKPSQAHLDRCFQSFAILSVICKKSRRLKINKIEEITAKKRIWFYWRNSSSLKLWEWAKRRWRRLTW